MPQRQREQRFDRAPLLADKQSQRSRRQREQRRHPPSQAFHLQQRQQQRRNEQRQPGGARQIQRVPPQLLMRRQIAPEEEHRQQADRQVDPEHQRPRQMLDDKRAQQRADDRRHAPHARQVAHHLRPLGGAVDVADDGGGDRHDGAGAQPLQQTEADQPIHVGGEAAQHRAQQEQRSAEEEHPLAAVEIRQAAVNGDGDRLRQQIDREHPPQQREAAEIADDGRHGSGDDGGFDRRHEHRQHAGDQNQRAVGDGCG